MKRFSQIVFLCTTNTFLSPVAEGIYRKNSTEWMPQAISRGLVVLFEEPINPKCNVLLTQSGFRISGHGQSRQLMPEDLKEGSLILTMTLSEKVKLIEEFSYEENVYTIGEFVGSDTDILEPVEEEAYKACADELITRVNLVIHKIEELYWEEDGEEDIQDDSIRQ
jgi:Protein-tyrosine-phosphatase